MSIWREKILHQFSESGNNGSLLIEFTGSSISIHQLCIYSYIVCSAKKLLPVFIAEESKRLWLKSVLERYFDKFQIIDKPVLPRWKCICLLAVALSTWSFLLLSRNLIVLKWRGQLIGDVVYDQYLASHCRGTVYYRDLRLAKIIYLIIRDIEVARFTVLEVCPHAVLLSHRVGLSCAPLAIASEGFEIPIYSFGGSMYGTLMLSRRRKKYEYTATSKELMPLLDLQETDFDGMFDRIKEELYRGHFNSDSKLAFANKLFTDRKEFADAHGLDATKKNVFVMLHAFTDYPHSHFNGMLFDDFLDWFLKTLEFASKQKDVNWIFKQHPSAHFYPVKDVDWDSLVREYTSGNVIFIPQGADFDSRSICHVGDATITCLGSAGFEFAAFAGIPTITAGDNPYTDAGFAIYPQSRAEYFCILQNLKTISKLNVEALRRAKATFMFIHRMSRVPMHAFVSLSHLEHRELQYGDVYFSKIDAHASDYQGLISRELQKYVAVVANPNFAALRSLPDEYRSLSNNISSPP